MADGGCTLVAALHQPRPAIWRLFDAATLLSQGRLLYHGRADSLVAWYGGRLGYSYDAARHGSAPDWALDLVSLGFSKQQQSGGQQAQQAQQQQHTGGGKAVDAAAAAVPAPAGASPGDAEGAGGAVPALARRSAMTTQSELDAAAAAMRARLEAEHPEWFLPLSATATTAPASRPASPPPPAAPPAPGRWAAARAAVAAPLAAFGRQYAALLRRELVIVSRNPADAAGRMATFAYVGLLDGLMHYALGGSAASLSDRIGVSDGEGRGEGEETDGGMRAEELPFDCMSPSSGGGLASFPPSPLPPSRHPPARLTNKQGVLHAAVLLPADAVRLHGPLLGRQGLLHRRRRRAPLLAAGLLLGQADRRAAAQRRRRAVVLPDVLRHGRAPARRGLRRARRAHRRAARAHGDAGGGEGSASGFGVFVARATREQQPQHYNQRHTHTIPTTQFQQHDSNNTTQAVYLCATVAPSQDTAFALAIAWTALNLLACGYLQRFAAYSLRGFAWVRYLSGESFSFGIRGFS